MTEALLLDAIKIVSPWLAIAGGIIGAGANFAKKVSPFIKEAIALYAKSVVASEHTAEGIKALAQGVTNARQGIDGLLEGKGCRAVDQWNGNERRTNASR